MARDDGRPGTPGWVDLQSAEPDAVMKFYAALLGWRFVDTGQHTVGHRTALLGERPVAGIGPLGEPGLPGWTTYVGVADVGETGRAVVAAGGAVLSTTADTAGQGRTAVFTDPHGTRFGACRADNRHQAPIDAAGAFSWGELITDDVDTSTAFYGEVFGWTVTAPEGPLERREWQLDGRSIAGLLPRPPAMAKDIAPYWDVYFTVADAEAATTAVIDLGGTQLMAPTDIGTGHIAVFLDPAGAVFTVLARKG